MVAEARLKQLIDAIEGTPPYLRAISLAVRSCYATKTPLVESFGKFQEDLLPEAAVLKKFLLPFAVAVLTGLKALFDEYTSYDFVTWNGSIAAVGETAREYERLCHCARSWFQHLGEDLKKCPDLVRSVTAEVPPDMYQFRQMAKVQYVRNSIGDGTFVSLLFIPDVGRIAAPYLFGPGASRKEPPAARNEFELAAAAALTSTDTLIPAVAKVLSLIDGIHSIFSELADELKELTGVEPDNEAKDYKQEERLAHYEAVGREAWHIQKKCNDLNSVKANFGYDCDFVPNHLVPDHPQEWLEAKEDPEGSNLADIVHDASKSVEILDILEPSTC